MNSRPTSSDSHFCNATDSSRSPDDRSRTGTAVWIKSTKHAGVNDNTLRPLTALAGQTAVPFVMFFGF